MKSIDKNAQERIKKIDLIKDLGKNKRIFGETKDNKQLYIGVFDKKTGEIKGERYFEKSYSLNLSKKRDRGLTRLYYTYVRE